MGWEGHKEGFAPLAPKKLETEYTNVAIMQAEVLLPKKFFFKEYGILDAKVAEKTLTFFSESGSVQIS